MVWISKNSNIRSTLYKFNKNDTFAMEYKSSNIEMVKYATVDTIYDKQTKNYSETSLAEPYNIICDIVLRTDPSSDFSEKKSISYDPDNNKIYLKYGVNRFKDILRINTQALEASYDSGEIYVICNECGKEVDINIDKQVKATGRNTMKNDKNDDIVTPCCKSINWKTKYRSE